MCPIPIKTPRFVRVQITWLGILIRCCQVAVIVFVLTYSLWYEKGYQVGIKEGEIMVSREI